MRSRQASRELRQIRKEQRGVDEKEDDAILFLFLAAFCFFGTVAAFVMAL